MSQLSMAATLCLDLYCVICRRPCHTDLVLLLANWSYSDRLNLYLFFFRRVTSTLCSIYRYVNKYNLPLTVLLHANCYTPFHGARKRRTSGGAVWLVVRVVFVVAINTCNTLQWRRVRDTNSCERTNYMLEWHSR